MIKLETHCHTLYGSHCGLADADTIVSRYLDAGYDGVVITNHFVKKHFDSYKGETDREKLDFYFSLFDEVKEKGEKKGLKVFLGSEVSACTSEEYMLVGFDRSLFYDNRPLFEMNQKELFELAEKNGLFFYQSHPFRDRVKVLGDPKYMHGAEVFNGHYHHTNFNEKAVEFCEKNNLIGLSGTDFHKPEQPITAGIIVPDYVTDEKKLVECLFKRDFEIICDEQTYLYELEKFLKEKEEKLKCK